MNESEKPNIESNIALVHGRVRCKLCPHEHDICLHFAMRETQMAMAYTHLERMIDKTKEAILVRGETLKLKPEAARDLLRMTDEFLVIRKAHDG